MAVSVALPVFNGARTLADVLAAVRAQEAGQDVELVVVDSGSRDDSVAIAKAHGAQVHAIAPADFNHGATRNLLMERTTGEHVAFLTQDAKPAGPYWLARLLEGFALGQDVALVCGPYRARPDASPMVARELDAWFASFGPLRVDRGPAQVLGPATFFSSANGAVLRSAWEQVPFRAVPYAEDQRLALDMLGAGFAKAYVADAAVVHSHDYPPLDQFRRVFDEFRALREVYAHREPVHPRRVLGRIRREVAADRRYDPGTPTLASVRYHAVRALGAGLGTRADRLPPPVRRWCSLERRATFEPSS